MLDNSTAVAAPLSAYEEYTHSSEERRDGALLTPPEDTGMNAQNPLSAGPQHREKDTQETLAR